MSDETPTREITLDELMKLRTATDAISSWLRSELQDRLETLLPMLSARRLLGGHLKSVMRENVKHADEEFEKLQESFRGISGEPFCFSGRMSTPLVPISTDLVLHPWEYSIQVAEGGKQRQVTLKSPVSWVLMHRAPISLGQARTMLTDSSNRNEDDLKQFAINALVMKQIFERSEGLQRLLRALRYDVELTTSKDTAALSLVRITTGLATFRPADSLILTATRLSGADAFEELVDLDSLQAVEDPWRAKLAELAQAASG